MEALVATLFLGGLRVGEARAWHWDDVDLDGGRFSVVRAIKDRAGTIGDPKWDKRRENLALPGLLRDALTRWRTELDDGYTDLVFPDPDGLPVSVTVIRRAWARMLEHAREKEILPEDSRWLTPHSARHSLNTHLLAERVPPLDVQLYLGWQSEAGRMLTRVQAGYTSVRLLDTTTVARSIDRLYAAKKASQKKTVNI